MFRRPALVLALAAATATTAGAQVGNFDQWGGFTGNVTRASDFIAFSSAGGSGLFCRIATRCSYAGSPIFDTGLGGTLTVRAQFNADGVAGRGLVGLFGWTFAPNGIDQPLPFQTIWAPTAVGQTLPYSTGAQTVTVQLEPGRRYGMYAEVSDGGGAGAAAMTLAGVSYVQVVPVQTVPEPAALTLVAAGASVLLARRRRAR